MIGESAQQVQLVERVVGTRRNGEVRELHQQIIFLIDGVLGDIGLDVLNIFVAEVEIASGGQRETVADLVLQFVAAFPYALGIELVFAIGMRSGDDVSDAVGDGHFGHLAPILRARMRHHRGRQGCDSECPPSCQEEYPRNAAGTTDSAGAGMHRVTWIQ